MAPDARLDAGTARLPGLLARARAIQPIWRDFPVEQRLGFLESLRAGLLRRRDTLAALISSETGKTRYEALTCELLPALLQINAVSASSGRLHARRFPAFSSLSTRQRRAVESQPYGVIAATNARARPLGTALRTAIPALAAGNAIILLADESAPRCAEVFAGLFEDAGFPEGLVQVTSGREGAGRLIELGVDHVSFSGAREDARELAGRCGESLTSCELRIESPGLAIVERRAALPRAAKSILWSAFANNGLSHGSVKLALVEERLAARFMTILVEEAQALRCGVDRQFKVDIGPLPGEEAYEEGLACVRRACARGCRLLTGGIGIADGVGGRFLSPAVLEVPPGRPRPDRLLEEGPLGPFIIVETVRDRAAAVRQANALPSDWSVSIWTTRQRSAEELTRGLKHQQVLINEAWHAAAAGLGPQSLRLDLDDDGSGPFLARGRSIAAERWPLTDHPFWFPYTRLKYEVVSDLLGRLVSRNPLWRGAALTQALLSFIRPRSASKPT